MAHRLDAVSYTHLDVYKRQRCTLYERKTFDIGGEQMLIAKVDKIIELRKAHGLNQKRLSEKAGLPVNAVFRIETGAYTRTQDLRAKAIANALECKVEEIFTSEQEAL